VLISRTCCLVLGLQRVLLCQAESRVVAQTCQPQQHHRQRPPHLVLLLKSICVVGVEVEATYSYLDSSQGYPSFCPHVDPERAELA